MQARYSFAAAVAAAIASVVLVVVIEPAKAAVISWQSAQAFTQASGTRASGFDSAATPDSSMVSGFASTETVGEVLLNGFSSEIGDTLAANPGGWLSGDGGSGAFASLITIEVFSLTLEDRLVEPSSPMPRATVSFFAPGTGY